MTLRAPQPGRAFSFEKAMIEQTPDIVIVANGVLADPEQLRTLVAGAQTVIAADGGGAHLHALGLRADWLIGDFDSLAPEILAAFERTGSRIERHPPGKDATDLELALDLARRLGGTRIRILAALGGRLDQTLGNLLLMAQATASGLDLALSNGPETIRVLRGPGRLVLAGAPGDTVSLLPIGGDAIDVTLTGLAYPLTNALLPFGTSRGISNVMAARAATIALDAGALVIVHTSMDNPTANADTTEVEG